MALTSYQMRQDHNSSFQTSAPSSENASLLYVDVHETPPSSVSAHDAFPVTVNMLSGTEPNPEWQQKSVWLRLYTFLQRVVGSRLQREDRYGVLISVNTEINSDITSTVRAYSRIRAGYCRCHCNEEGNLSVYAANDSLDDVELSKRELDWQNDGLSWAG